MPQIIDAKVAINGPAHLSRIETLKANIRELSIGLNSLRIDFEGLQDGLARTEFIDVKLLGNSLDIHRKLWRFIKWTEAMYEFETQKTLGEMLEEDTEAKYGKGKNVADYLADGDDLGTVYHKGDGDFHDD